jgi:drug/metabolite transporter (DMT)-like permease
LLNGIAARAQGVSRTLLTNQGVGLVIITVLLFLSGNLREGLRMTSVAAVFGICAAAANIAGTFLLMKALSIGKVALIAPLSATYGVVTLILSLLSGEKLQPAAITGSVLCIAGACLMARGGEKTGGAPQGVALSLLSALCLGIGFWLQGRFAIPRLGVLKTLWMLYLLGFALAGVLVVRASVEPSLRVSGWLRASLPLASILSLSGFAALAVGTAHGSVAIVTSLSTLAGGAAAILAVLFRAERLDRMQWFGLLSVLCGLPLLHANLS